MNLRLTVQTVARDVAGLEDDALGESLAGMVREAVARKGAPTVATVARADRVDLIGLAPVVEGRLPVHGFLASLTRAEVDPGVLDPHAVGLMGTVRVRRPGDGVDGAPVAVVFLEWPDCRWWHWRALIEPTTGALLDHTETIRRAIDGDPLPDGLGRWWSAGRRQPGRARLAKASDSPMVH